MGWVPFRQGNAPLHASKLDNLTKTHPASCNAGAGCYYILCKNTCVCEVNKLERRFYLVDAQVLPEVFLKVVKAKELGQRGGAQHFGCDPQRRPVAQCFL